MIRHAPKMAHSIQARFEARCKEDPGARALAFVESDGEPRWLSRSALRAKALRIGGVFVRKGLEPGDVCMLVLPSDAFSHVMLLGCLLVGGVPILVAPPIVRGFHSYLPEVIRSVVRRSRTRIIVWDDTLGHNLNEVVDASIVSIPISKLKNIDVDAASVFLPEPDAIAALQLTSGTTGSPRICVWRQDRVLTGLDGMERAMGLGAEDVCVNWTPLYHDMSLVNNFLLCLTAGVPLAVIETMEFLRNPAVWLRALASAQATTTWSPNFGFAYAKNRVSPLHLDGVRLDGMRAFWNAAERVHLETMKSFYEKFEPLGLKWTALKTNFGCAENVGGATFTHPENDLVVELLDSRMFYEEGIACQVPIDQPGAVCVVGVGRPYPGMTIRIADDQGRELPDGHLGRILLDTPSRMSGYLGDEQATREALCGDWLFTGDVGYRRGQELFWTGRVRERINLQGRKYDPSDFEKVLLSVAGLREGCFAVFGVDDVDLGTQRLVILSEIRKDEEASAERVLEDIREQVLIQMGVRVDEIHLLPNRAMTKTSSGKRRHRFYHQLYLQGEVQSLMSWGTKPPTSQRVAEAVRVQE